MFLQRVFRITELFATGAMLLLTLTSVGLCQNAPVQEVESDPTETIEEIVVYGEKSLIRLRYELYKAEEVVFDLFNSLNSDDEFDIHCYKEAPIGSHIKRRICTPNYVRELVAEATRLALLGIIGSYSHPVAKIQQKDKLLREEMEALVIERPELLKALSEFADAKQILETERQRRCEGRLIICRK